MPSEAELLERIDEMRRVTVRGRVKAIVDATLANLRRVDALSPATLARPHPEGSGPAYVVSAGPGLDRNASGLRWAKGTVFAVNSAIPALRRRGIEPDVGVTLEHMDFSSHLAEVPLLAVDISAHPAAWDAAIRCGRGVWFGGGSPHALRMQRTIGVPPLLYSGGVSTAAFALAAQWGFDPIVLVGQDLAYDLGRGRSYAEGSGWAGLEVRRDGGRLLFEGAPERDTAHAAAKIPLVPRDRDGIAVPGWHGGEVWTTLEFYAQRLWLSQMAPRVKARCINATESGARIPGWEHVSLRDVVATAGRARGVDLAAPASEAKRDQALDEIRAEARHAVALADWFLGDGSGPLPEAREMPLVGGLASGDMLGVKELKLDPDAALFAQYECYRAAALHVLKVVGDG